MTTVKFQEKRCKTVGGVLCTRYLLLGEGGGGGGGGRTDGRNSEFEKAGDNKA